MGSPERPSADHVVSMAEAAVTALLEADCLNAVHELARVFLDDRAETLAHGLTAARAPGSQVEDSRRLAIVLLGLLPADARDQLDPDGYLWTPGQEL